MDGTLLTSALTLSQAVRDAVQEVASSGVEIILASGRPAQSLRETAATLGGVNYAIPSNGGAVVDLKAWKSLHAFPMSNVAASTIEARAVERSIRTCAYDPLSWSVEAFDAWVELEVQRSGTRPRLRSRLDGHGEAPIKLMLIGPPPILAEFQSLQLEPLGQVIESFFTYPEYLEVMPRGVSKAEAVTVLLEHLGIDPANTIAIGDGANDAEMLRRAGIGVAVANASSQALAAASYVAPSNDNDGVAVALRALLLKDPLAVSAMRKVASSVERGNHGPQ